MFLGGIYGEPVDSYLNVCMEKLIDMDPENSAQFKIPPTIKLLFFAMKYSDKMKLAGDLLESRKNSFIATIFVFDPETCNIYIHKGTGISDQLFEDYYKYIVENYYNIFGTNLNCKDLIDLRTFTHSLN